jgi:magnesium-transporting ATPase (P-type)
MLGCTTVICANKTGTLTTNEMTVVGQVLLEKEGIIDHTIQGTSYSPVGSIEGIQYNEEVHQDLNGAVADFAAVSGLCNDANIVGNGSAYEEQSDNEDAASPARESQDAKANGPNAGTARASNEQ